MKDHGTRLDATVTLADGRRLGFAEFGEHDGWPVLWFHGTPGARRQVPPLARAAAADLGVRIIGVERPGIGRSTDHQYRSIAEFAADVETLVDRLGIDRFGVVGLSGGGPYTLGTAHRLPDRVFGAAVLGGVAPTVGPHACAGGPVPLTNRLASVTPALVAPLGGVLWSIVNGLQPFGSRIYGGFSRLMPPGDQEVFASDGMEEMFIGDLSSGSRRQCRAAARDIVLFGRHWGFDPSEISVPVRWWHGDADPIVPQHHAETMVDVIPDAELFLRPGESHLGGFGAAREVLRVLDGLRG